MGVKCTPLLELKVVEIVGSIVRRGVTLLGKEVVVPAVGIAATQISSDVLLENMNNVDRLWDVALCPSGCVDCLTRVEIRKSIQRARW